MPGRRQVKNETAASIFLVWDSLPMYMEFDPESPCCAPFRALRGKWGIRK